MVWPSRDFGDRAGLASPRCDGGAVVADGAGLDDKAVGFQHGAKFSVAGALLGIDPGNQYTRQRKKVNEPVQRRLERIDRVLAPINEGHIELTVRQPQVVVVATRL